MMIRVSVKHSMPGMPRRLSCATTHQSRKTPPPLLLTSVGCPRKRSAERRHKENKLRGHFQSVHTSVATSRSKGSEPYSKPLSAIGHITGVYRNGACGGLSTGAPSPVKPYGGVGLSHLACCGERTAQKDVYIILYKTSRCQQFFTSRGQFLFRDQESVDVIEPRIGFRDQR